MGMSRCGGFFFESACGCRSDISVGSKLVSDLIIGSNCAINLLGRDLLTMPIANIRMGERCRLDSSFNHTVANPNIFVESEMLDSI